MKRRKNIKNIIGGGLTICLLICLTKYSEYILRPSGTDQCVAAIDAFHNMPEKSMEVIIYGSSHGWRGVSSVELYEKYGIAAYNYGGNWQCLSTEALFFYDSLRTQSPKVVMIETFRINDVIMDQDLDGEIYYTRNISNFPYKKYYLKQAFEDSMERYLAYYFPISQFHSSWNDLSINNFKKWYTQEDFEGTMGYFYTSSGDDVTPVVIDAPSTFEQYELCQEAIEILDDIVKTCKEKSIELIFFTTPWAGQNNYSDAMSRYSEVKGCMYIDFFKCIDEVGINVDTDFRDEGHLNNNGAIKIADYLGKYLVERYDFEDMRLVDDNLWEGKLGNKTGKARTEWDLTHDELLKYNASVLH